MFIDKKTQNNDQATTVNRKTVSFLILLRLKVFFRMLFIRWKGMDKTAVGQAQTDHVMPISVHRHEDAVGWRKPNKRILTQWRNLSARTHHNNNWLNC